MASHSTANLRLSCRQEGARYIDNTPFFLAKSGAPRKAMYRDKIHPSTHGCKVLATNICRAASKTPPSNHNRPPTESRKRRVLTDEPPVTTDYSPSYDYETDFPANSPKKPTSPSVYNVLGRHQRPLKQPLLRSPSQQYSISPPDNRMNHQQHLGYRNENYTLSPHSASPPSMSTQHTTSNQHTPPLNVPLLPLPNTAQLPLPNTVHLSPPNAAHLPHPPNTPYIPPPPHTAHLPPATTTLLPPPNPSQYRPPNTPHHPLQSVQTTGPLHPFAVQLLNTMTAQFLSQQHQSAPPSMSSLY